MNLIVVQFARVRESCLMDFIALLRKDGLPQAPLLKLVGVVMELELFLILESYNTMHCSQCGQEYGLEQRIALKEELIKHYERDVIPLKDAKYQSLLEAVKPVVEALKRVRIWIDKNRSPKWAEQDLKIVDEALSNFPKELL